MARPVGSIKPVRTNFADHLNDLLKEKEISCYNLAKEIGYSEGCLSRVKQRQAEPSVGLLLAVAKYFNVTTDFLLK